MVLWGQSMYKVVKLDRQYWLHAITITGRWLLDNYQDRKLALLAVRGKLTLLEYHR